MNNPMADANVAIINEIERFMETAITDCAEKSKYTVEKTRDFTRRRILTFPVLILMILNAMKRSLSIEIADFFSHVFPGESCTKQAFSKQRGKLKPAFFHACNRVLINGFYRHYGSHVKRWKGMVLWAVDGRTVPLPQTESLKKAFGGAGNQHAEKPVSVTARICLFYDVLNGLTVKGALHPYYSSEDSACAQSLEEMDFADKVLILDRGYVSYWLLYLLMEKDIKFVMRVKQGETNSVKQFMKSSRKDLTTLWYPSHCSRKRLAEKGRVVNRTTGLKIRMVKVMLNTGETEVPVTNLYDSHVYDSQSMKEVYGLRWGIETGYGHLKEKLQPAQFSGIRQVCIEQDFAAGLLLLNLQSLIEKQSEPYLKAVNRQRISRYRVNKNVSLGMLKHRVVSLFLEKQPLAVLMELENLFGKHLEPVRPGRKYSRARKHPPKGKFYTLTNYKRAL
jgi:hypothetical protein